MTKRLRSENGMIKISLQIALAALGVLAIVVPSACGGGGGSAVDRRVCNDAFVALQIGLGVSDRDLTDCNDLAFAVESDASKLDDKNIRLRAKQVGDAVHDDPITDESNRTDLVSGAMGHAFLDLAEACKASGLGQHEVLS